MGGISVWQLLIIAVIVALLFGTKRLRTLGGDLGASIKGFQNAMKNDKAESNTSKENLPEPDSDFQDVKADSVQTKEKQ